MEGKNVWDHPLFWKNATFRNAQVRKKRLFCFTFKLIFVFSVAAWLYPSNCY